MHFFLFQGSRNGIPKCLVFKPFCISDLVAQFLSRLLINRAIRLYQIRYDNDDILFQIFSRIDRHIEYICRSLNWRSPRALK